MKKTFTLTCKNDLMNLIGKKSFETSLVGEYDFATYRYGDSELPIVCKGAFGDDSNGFKIERRVTLSKDMSSTDVDFFSNMTLEELDKQINVNLNLLQEHYNNLQKEADKLQMELLYTAMLMRIRDAKCIKPVAHTRNLWVRHDITQYEYKAERSNMVYRMYYRVYMEHPWDTSTKSSKKMTTNPNTTKVSQSTRRWNRAAITCLSLRRRRSLRQRKRCRGILTAALRPLISTSKRSHLRSRAIFCTCSHMVAKFFLVITKRRLDPSVQVRHLLLELGRP